MPDRTPGGGASEFSPAADQLSYDADRQRDELAWDVTCFAYNNFWDTEDGEVVLPSEADFIQSVSEEFAPAGSDYYYRAKADDLYDLYYNLEAGEFRAVATDIACL